MYKLLENARVKKYIADRMAEIENEKIAQQKEILQYLTSLMRGNETEQTLIAKGEGSQEITNIDVGAKDRIKAAELLGKRYSMWTDKVDMTGSLEIVFEDDYGEED